MTTLLATGDLIIDEPDPHSYFDPARAVVRAADVVVGPVEVPFTLRRQGTPNIPLEARDPAKLRALANAGVRVASLGANHLYDDGTPVSPGIPQHAAGQVRRRSIRSG